MQIYVRNRYFTTNRTMVVTVQAEATVQDSNSVFGIVSLILFLLMFSFICICIGAIIRMCIRKRQLEEQIEQNQINLRVDLRQQIQTQEQRVQSLIELIRERPYDKSLNHFKQAECVICFEEFQQGVPIRKIPIC